MAEGGLGGQNEYLYEVWDSRDFKLAESRKGEKDFECSAAEKSEPTVIRILVECV